MPRVVLIGADAIGDVLGVDRKVQVVRIYAHEERRYSHAMTDASGSRPARDRAARLGLILDRLAERGRLEVAEAASMLGVSGATVRRDFSELSRRQLATRRHGGIVATSVAYELPYRYRASREDDDKRRVAERAAALVAAGEVVGFNGGTTTTQAARALAAREDLVDGTGVTLTVVTNALNIASEMVLRPHIQCVSLGGVARPESYEVTGPFASLVLDQLWLDVVILGVNGVSAAEGATCRHEDEAAVCAHLVRRARRVVVVATGTKVGQRAFAAIAPVSQIDLLVTDDSAPDEASAELVAAGVEVVRV